MKSHAPLRSELPPHFTAADLPLLLRFGGHDATLRWIEPEDMGDLVQLFASHYEEAVRPGAATPIRLRPDDAERLVRVDQIRDVALGMFEHAGYEQRLIGLAHYWLSEDSGRAEGSFIVHDQRRGIGVATALLHALLAIARERRVREFVAHVRPDNAPMIHLLRVAGASFRRLRDEFMMEAAIRLHPSDGRPVPATATAPRREAAAWARDVAARIALRLEDASEALQKFPTP